MLKRTLHFNLKDQEVTDHITAMMGLPQKAGIVTQILESIDHEDLKACVDSSMFNSAINKLQELINEMRRLDMIAANPEPFTHPNPNTERQL